jgi:DNA polymerase IV
MRRMHYCAGAFELSVRFMDRSGWHGRRRIKATDDSLLFLKVLGVLWQEMFERSGPKNILKVGVCLSEVLEAEQTTRDLFSWKPKAKPNANLSAAMDRIHQRFGRKALTIGVEPAELADLGTKIAFTRVPDASEFEE